MEKLLKINKNFNFGLSIIGITILAFSLLLSFNSNAAPKGGCLPKTKNVCMIVPYIGEIDGVLYMDIR